MASSKVVKVDKLEDKLECRYCNKSNVKVKTTNKWKCRDGHICNEYSVQIEVCMDCKQSIIYRVLPKHYRCVICYRCNKIMEPCDITI